jgi:hypothetical protein
MSEHPNDHDPEIAEMTQRLLGSWHTDAAPKGAKQRTMVALGVGLATTATAATASALGSATRVGMLGIAKAVAGGALAGVVVLGTSTYIQHGHATAPVAATPVPAEGTAKPSSRGVPPAPAAQAPSETEIDPSPAAATPSASPAARPMDEGSNAPTTRQVVSPEEATALVPLPEPPRGSTPGSSQKRVSSLARETALLDESRSSLARGDGAGALKLLDRHAREFAHGNLGPEAVVMRIEALLRLGDERSARALASQFAMDHPDDSHLARIRSLLTNNKRPTGDRP